MKRTVRAAVAGLAFTALVAQPVAANATTAAHHFLLPLYVTTVVVCTALTLGRFNREGGRSNDQAVRQARAGDLLLCAVPGVGLVRAIRNHK